MKKLRGKQDGFLSGIKRIVDKDGNFVYAGKGLLAQI